MTTQPTFWGHADTAARQGQLFDAGGRAIGLRCVECSRYLERTPSGYLACPSGHRKLVRESEDDPQSEDETDALLPFPTGGPPDPPKAA
jgi:hypothetical protein